MTDGAEAPPVARGPRLAVIGDVHGHFKRLGRVLDRIDEVDPDGVLLVGDLACCGHESTRSAETVKRYHRKVKKVLAQVRERGRPMWFVPGNHDLPVISDPANLDGRSASLGGIRMAGLGGAGPDIFGFAYEWSDEELRERARFLPQADLLLCHAPPHGTPIDVIARGAHVGSHAIRELAQRTNGVLVCGHIHESPGMVRLGDCLCLNVGGLGEPFGRARVGFVMGLDRLIYEDLDAGTSQEWRREGAEVRLPPVGLG